MANSKPSDEMLNKIKWGCIILMAIVYPIMMYYFILAAYPQDIFLMGQLSFSGEVMKDFHYETKNLASYKQGQIWDYGYMVAYGGLLFALSLINARKFNEGSKYRSMGQSVSTFGIFAALFDMLENGFILMMLENPFAFPDWYAVLHSVCALIKWILIVTTIVWIVISGYLYRKQSKEVAEEEGKNSQ